MLEMKHTSSKENQVRPEKTSCKSCLQDLCRYEKVPHAASNFCWLEPFVQGELVVQRFVLNFLLDRKFLQINDDLVYTSHLPVGVVTPRKHAGEQPETELASEAQTPNACLKRQAKRQPQKQKLGLPSTKQLRQEKRQGALTQRQRQQHSGRPPRTDPTSQFTLLPQGSPQHAGPSRSACACSGRLKNRGNK